MFKELEGQTENLVDYCIDTSYFMRGAIQYEDCMELTPLEKKRMSKFLEKRLEKEAAKPNPNY